jgi:hypothetical protein
MNGGPHVRWGCRDQQHFAYVGYKIYSLLLFESHSWAEQFRQRQQ